MSHSPQQWLSLEVPDLTSHRGGLPQEMHKRQGVVRECEAWSESAGTKLTQDKTAGPQECESHRTWLFPLRCYFAEEQ